MKQSGKWKKTVKTLFSRRIVQFSAVVVGVFIGVAVFAPLILGEFDDFRRSIFSAKHYPFD